MDNNDVQEIELGLFSSDSQLTYLSLDNNRINRLQPNTFEGMNQLAMLKLQGNHIQVLERDAFRNLSALRTIMLSNNQIQRIEQGAFQDLGSLTSLYLSYFSTEDFHMDGVGFLAQMPALTNLEMMASPALAEAFMTQLDQLTGSSQLRLNHVITLDLSYNTLEYVSPLVRTVFPNLQKLYLDDNELRCTQRLRWLRDWMRASPTVIFKKSSDLFCDSPPNLQGRRVDSIQPHEWGSDNSDRSREVRNADLVNQHEAQMARDMAGQRMTSRKSVHVEANHQHQSADSMIEAPRQGDNSSITRSRNNGTMKSPANRLKERANREERRKKKLRRRRRKGGKKKNRKRGKKRGRKGKKKNRKERKGRKRQSKGDGVSRVRREVLELTNEKSMDIGI